MPVYSLKDFKERGNNKPRTLELTEKTKKIWIPEIQYAYKRVHFNIKTMTTFKNSRFGGLDCLNCNLGERGKGCPLCAEYDALWEKWRKTNDKAEKKKIQDIVNRILTEEYWFNCVDLSEPDKLPFAAVRFTASKMKDIVRIDDEYGIENVLLLISRKEEGEGKTKKVTYVIQEDPDNTHKINELKEMYETLAGRDYEAGGKVDLNKLTRKYTKDEYLEILEGSEHKDEPDEIVEEESTMSLSDVDMTDTPKAEPSKPKTAAKPAAKEEVKDDDLSLDLEDSLELDLEDAGVTIPEKTFDVSALFVKENTKRVELMESIFGFFVQQETLANCETYKEKVQSLFAFLKKEGIQKVPEKYIVGEYTAVVNL